MICLGFGFMLSLLSAAIWITFLFPVNWHVTGSLPADRTAPTYLAPIAPPLTHIDYLTPSGPWSRPLLGGLNVGVDSIDYHYGPSFWKPDYEPWDTSKSSEPTRVRLTRHRFGWPKRFLSMDYITTGQSTADPIVRAYHQQANTLAAHHRGLSRPAWLPRFIPLHRVPQTLDARNLAINTICWAVICLAIFQCKHLIRSSIQRRRRSRGLCPTCRYDLQSLPTCPECGQNSTPNAKCPVPHADP